MWTLAERKSRVILGDVGFLADADGIEIGWHLRRESWGLGYATEAARACLTYGLSELGFHRVSAYVETANAASVRVINKLGMSFARTGADGVPPWAEYAIDRASATRRAACDRRSVGAARHDGSGRPDLLKARRQEQARA